MQPEGHGIVTSDPYESLAGHVVPFFNLKLLNVVFTSAQKNIVSAAWNVCVRIRM